MTVNDKKKVYLTFDDGPTTLTPRILDLLKQKEVHGTYFIKEELNQLVSLKIAK
ncbi:polysaccharide deacetylase family protein [Tepidibacillus fermentans]|uniref:polysaccharide deacetylase family protein n=1 Tax=Tepidibacillus fermentans TaxID=1281767 RepID=UPI001A9D8C13|nr:polysaccharide deacetylase family protein [Tepidibacillus fermentans]